MCYKGAKGPLFTSPDVTKFIGELARIYDVSADQILCGTKEPSSKHEHCFLYGQILAGDGETCAVIVWIWDERDNMWIDDSKRS